MLVTRHVAPLLTAILLLSAAACSPEPPRSADQWEPVEIKLAAERDHPWWEFPVSAELANDDSGRKITLEGYWTGPSAYVIRFAAPEPGHWRYVTRSRDAGLDENSGSFDVAAIEKSALRAEP